MTNGTRTETIDAATGAAQIPVAQAVHGVSFAEATRLLNGSRFRAGRPDA